ncbi:MAG: hypothetical protein AB2A00_10420 [Myxococcota bacterium]
MAALYPDTWLRSLLDAYVAEHDNARISAMLGRHARVTRGARSARRWARFHLHASGLAYGLPVPRPSLLPVEHHGDTRHHLPRLSSTVAHLADLTAHCAVLVEKPLTQKDLRAVLVASLAATLDHGHGARLLVDPDAVAEAEVSLGKALVARAEAFGSAHLGLALHSALTCVDARAHARVSLRILVDGADAHDWTRGILTAAQRERALAVSALCGLEAAAGRARSIGERAARKQLAGAGLSRVETRELARILSSTDPELPEQGYALGRRMADLVLGQLVLSALVDGRITRAEQQYIDDVARALRVPPSRARRLARRAERIFGAHKAELLTLVEQAVEPEVFGSALAARTQKVLQKNLDALVQEIRETGELAQLLARAASGNALTPAEWQKVRDQLLDVCLAVPSLAVFALPGGALLLPLLLKVLPFDLRPSSFRDPPALPPLESHS